MSPAPNPNQRLCVCPLPNPLDRVVVRCPAGHARARGASLLTIVRRATAATTAETTVGCRLRRRLVSERARCPARALSLGEKAARPPLVCPPPRTSGVRGRRVPREVRVRRLHRRRFHPSRVVSSSPGDNFRHVPRALCADALKGSGDKGVADCDGEAVAQVLEAALAHGRGASARPAHAGAGRARPRPLGAAVPREHGHGAAAPRARRPPHLALHGHVRARPQARLARHGELRFALRHPHRRTYAEEDSPRPRPDPDPAPATSCADAVRPSVLGPVRGLAAYVDQQSCATGRRPDPMAWPALLRNGM